MLRKWWTGDWRKLIVVVGVLIVGIPLAIQAGRWIGRDSNSLPTPSPTGGGPRMVKIPGGTFRTGPPMENDVQAPPSDVTLSEYEMDETEVTVEQYGQCVDAGACEAASTNEAGDDTLVNERLASKECNFPHRATLGNHPVNCVGVKMAAAFCRWAGKRLPTADEWEFAARGTDGRKFPWGNFEPTAELLNGKGTECVNSPAITDIRHQARTTFPWNDGYPLTAPVATFPKGRSPFGLFDMAGNVLEFATQGAGLHTAVSMGGAWSFARMVTWERISGGGWLALSDEGFRCARSVITARPARR